MKRIKTLTTKIFVLTFFLSFKLSQAQALEEPSSFLDLTLQSLECVPKELSLEQEFLQAAERGDIESLKNYMKSGVNSKVTNDLGKQLFIESLF